jgi:hypothetical protein
MDVGLRTPLLDFFRRGDVALDVRLLAAQGAVAPRPMEQLGLLVLLTDDPDPQVRDTAAQTLEKLPVAQVAALLARAEAPSELRAFFASRDVTPATVPSAGAEGPPLAVDPDAPLIDTDDAHYVADDASTEEKAEAVTRLSDMTVPQKVKCAMKGTREMRAVLIRDPNKMVAAAVLSCPKVTEQEVETFAKMANVSEDILRTIASTRAWTKTYGVTLGLTKNPKTPLSITLTLLHRLNDRDLRGVSIDRNVPEPLRLAAKKKIAATQK